VKKQSNSYFASSASPAHTHHTTKRTNKQASSKQEQPKIHIVLSESTKASLRSFIISTATNLTQPSRNINWQQQLAPQRNLVCVCVFVCLVFCALELLDSHSINHSFIDCSSDHKRLLFVCFSTHVTRASHKTLSG